MACDLARRRLGRRLVAEGQRADRQRLDRVAGQAGRRLRIVVAGDPEPVAPRHHRRKIEPHPARQARCALAVMKTVAEADDNSRPVVVDHRLEPQQRRHRVVGRHQHAAPRQRRALFEMQVGDAEQAEVREKERAAAVAERGLAGHRDLRGMGRARKKYRFRPSHCLPLLSRLVFPSPLRSALPLPTEANRPPRRRPVRGRPPA